MKKAMKVILKNDKMRKFVCLLACGWGILGLSSCQDTQLAEQLDGTWHTSFTQKDEDGIPYTEEEDVKFIYMKSNAKDGGKFKEKVTIGTATEYYTVNESYKIVCTISGEWEIIGGDLYMGYDLSSLDVKVKDLNCELSWNAALGASILGIDYNNIRAEEIRKDTYREMYEYYKDSNKENDLEYCFLDLSIEDSIMSYSTADLGRLKWRRVE